LKRRALGTRCACAKLSPEAAPLYTAAAKQYRKLKTLLNRLDKLSKNILLHQAKLAESKRRD
jgi:hypothetical protein